MLFRSGQAEPLVDVPLFASSRQWPVQLTAFLFGMSVLGGTSPASVEVSTTSGQATLVYQIDRTGGVISISREDITTSAGLTAMTNGLTDGAIVKVFGLPTSSGTLQAYVLMYYTGSTMPAQ